jgi:predicted RNA methylase
VPRHDSVSAGLRKARGAGSGIGALLMTADRGQAQSVEKARQYQMLIPNSQLVVVRSDAYHIAAVNADECVANVLDFIKEAKRKA